MPDYRVAWEIDVFSADSPEAAARKAWETMRKPESTANVFQVEDGNEVFTVDLTELAEAEPASIPPASVTDALNGTAGTQEHPDLGIARTLLSRMAACVRAPDERDGELIEVLEEVDAFLAGDSLDPQDWREYLGDAVGALQMACAVCDDADDAATMRDALDTLDSIETEN